MILILSLISLLDGINRHHISLWMLGLLSFTVYRSCEQYIKEIKDVNLLGYKTDCIWFYFGIEDRLQSKLCVHSVKLILLLMDKYWFYYIYLFSFVKRQLIQSMTFFLFFTTNHMWNVGNYWCWVSRKYRHLLMVQKRRGQSCSC